MTRSILISGGSRGIGRATALRAARAGWNVAFTYRSDAEAAEATAAEVEASGSTAVALQGDTTTEADVVRVFAEAKTTLGHLDAVVVNAGIVGPSQPLAEMSVDRIKTILDTNVLGAMLFAREAARVLPREGTTTSSIVFVSSAAARLRSPNEYVDYAASKGAIDTLTIGLSKELAPQNIRVNGVRPGLIETDIHASGGQPDRAARLGRNVPMARAGTAAEVAEAIFWLCDDASSYATGSILDVAGGR